MNAIVEHFLDGKYLQDNHIQVVTRLPRDVANSSFTERDFVTHFHNSFSGTKKNCQNKNTR